MGSCLWQADCAIKANGCKDRFNYCGETDSTHRWISRICRVSLKNSYLSDVCRQIKRDAHGKNPPPPPPPHSFHCDFFDSLLFGLHLLTHSVITNLHRIFEIVIITWQKNDFTRRRTVFIIRASVTEHTNNRIHHKLYNENQKLRKTKTNFHFLVQTIRLRKTVSART